MSRSEMIETDFFILTKEQYDSVNDSAEQLNLSVDYYLMEFCEVEGPYVRSN
jgi:hypothetical protein